MQQKPFTDRDNVTGTMLSILILDYSHFQDKQIEALLGWVTKSLWIP